MKVVKNKGRPPFKTADFDILYGEGISREGEMIDMGVNPHFLDKRRLVRLQGREDRPGQDNSREFLRENPDLAHEIENRIRESLGISLAAASWPAPKAPEPAGHLRGSARPAPQSEGRAPLPEPARSIRAANLRASSHRMPKAPSRSMRCWTS